MSIFSNWVLDLLTVIILVVFTIVGVKRGFVKALANTAGWVVSLLVAYLVSEPVAAVISAENGADSEFVRLIIRVIVFFVVFIAAKILIKVIGAALNALVNKIPLVSTLNKILGGVFGLCEGALLLLVLTMILRLYALATDTGIPVDDTFLYHIFWNIFV